MLGGGWPADVLEADRGRREGAGGGSIAPELMALGIDRVDVHEVLFHNSDHT
jgi:hypothetical protein